MTSVWKPALGLVLLSAILAAATKYSGPRPSKPDILYLQHADNLIETEVTDASEQPQKDGAVYVIPGESSPARTPLAGPIFLLLSEKLTPEQLQLYRLEVKNGHREVFVSPRSKHSARPRILSITRLAEKLYRIEVDDYLENGQYCLSPSGSNQVFCFTEY